MDTFYSLYTKNFGKLSEAAFNLFWGGNYQNCYDLYRQIINYTGSINALGYNDILIYHHCLIQLKLGTAENISLPSPPTDKEINGLYEYEINQERLISNTSGKNILSQPSILSKAILASHIGLQNNCREVIETGTFLGGSTYLFSGIFNSVETIEADQNLYESSREWLLNKRENIRCHIGDSAKVIDKILKEKDKKQLIFLDAHYSTGITSKKYGICPLIEELEVIKSHQREHTVVIDDIRCMGSEGYPSMAEILKLIPEGKKITIQYDQMVIS